MRLESRGLADVLVLLEHEPVYTLGSGATLEHVKFDVTRPPCDLFRIERGGEVTYHGPGQLVGYPIVQLRHHKKDLRWYMRSLEQVIINTLAHYGVEGTRKEGLTGVWHGDRKLAAIGVAASKWVTMHGFAINVRTDLAPFNEIVPCGIADKGVMSLHERVPNVTLDDVRAVTAKKFGEYFGLDMVEYVTETTTAATNVDLTAQSRC
eukprot:CAMPEP_0198724342 /NCGR_PEP_ID=MMETSP1475-20131203/1830_1 /TAXON_ID= ORGANISM="Unidentified sp., Strain CCMP1999" /NCGR_SAMPLE_ID=MMETSP1475 /ASSEMBLY_ACC=CAM_ASM_001111 /LENGTH=206 /DNA_ID=CAMNT_0044485841 /DNA_START=171 /DNA_END=791 /DNA_ORIENTATION=+